MNSLGLALKIFFLCLTLHGGGSAHLKPTEHDVDDDATEVFSARKKRALKTSSSWWKNSRDPGQYKTNDIKTCREKFGQGQGNCWSSLGKTEGVRKIYTVASSHTYATKIVRDERASHLPLWKFSTPLTKSSIHPCWTWAMLSSKC